MTNKETFIETANRIGERLVNTALWDGDKCTWEIRTYDKSRPKDRISITEPAGGTIYQGTAGISLFLCELLKQTGNIKFIHTAEGGLKFSLATLSTLPKNSFGFHSGKTGIAYLAVKIGKYYDKIEFINKSYDIIKSLIGKEETDSGLDVIGGAAGAIPILLSGIFENENSLQLAINLGENIIKTAHKEPVGWSWFGEISNFRNLCGLAHGASGYGHALIEIYNATGLSKYLYAAEQAFLYERQFIDAKKQNWPDFRHKELSEYLFYGEIDILKKIVKEGTLPKYDLKYMNAWCHGSPGIGLTRLRAFEITEQDMYRREAEIAIEGTKSSLEMENGWSGNFSLCHGIFGNCETLLYGSKILNNKELLNIAEDIAASGCEKYEMKNKPWPTGVLGAGYDPSLILGEAGMGYYLLRLCNDSIPSILLPHPETKKDFKRTLDDSYLSVQNEYVNLYFGKTLTALKKINTVQPLIQFNFSSDLENNVSEIQSVQKNIEKIINKNDSEEIKIVEEIFSSENIKYKQTIGLTDYTEEFLFSLEKEDITKLNSGNTLLCLVPSAEILECKYDSVKWINSKNGASIKDYEVENYVLLYKNKNKFYKKNISYLTYLLLSQLKIPLTINDLISKTLDFLEIKNASEQSKLKEIIFKQISEVYNSNLIKEFKGNSADGASGRYNNIH